MSLSYIVFCRIVGLKELPNDELSASVGVLADVVKDACGNVAQKEPAKIHSSVYGRLLVVPWHVADVLAVARSIRKKAEKMAYALPLELPPAELWQLKTCQGRMWLE